jgi:predicted MFS family arabinose efflux permease
MSRGSASAATMEAEPPDMRYQALPGNEYKFLNICRISLLLIVMMADICLISAHFTINQYIIPTNF